MGRNVTCSGEESSGAHVLLRIVIANLPSERWSRLPSRPSTWLPGMDRMAAWCFSAERLSAAPRTTSACWPCCAPAAAAAAGSSTPTAAAAAAAGGGEALVTSSAPSSSLEPSGSTAISLEPLGSCSNSEGPGSDASPVGGLGALSRTASVDRRPILARAACSNLDARRPAK